MTLVHESRRRTELVARLRSEVPRTPPAGGRARAPRRLEVFATGTSWVQLTWTALGPGRVEVLVGEGSVAVEADGGPGAVLVEGLRPGTAHVVELAGPGMGGRSVLLATRTLPAPGGELLHRIATVSDVHLGSTGTGYLHTIVEKPVPAEPHPARCARAALTEASGWGADELVVKGDLVDHSEPALWAAAADVLGDFDGPVAIVPGNHEWASRGDGKPLEGARAHGLDLVDGVAHLDRPGIRVVLVDTAVPGHDVGRISSLMDDVVQRAADAPGPVLVAMHHQPTRFSVPLYLPAGVPGPDARRFLDALAAANPHALVTSGHTHRHRRRHHGPVTVTEVGATKDFPGTWAGYEVHEGGIVQVVRRIAEPSCIRWTDHTRRAALGAWSRWSPGRLADRCFTRTW